MKEMLSRLIRWMSGLSGCGVLAIYGYMVVWGLPRGIQDILLSELKERGLIVEMKQLKLDLGGGIGAWGLRLYKDPEKTQLWLEVDRAHLDVAWLAWLRGKSLFERASVANARIFIPVGNKLLRLTEVNATVEFFADRMEVLYAGARFLNAAVEFQGSIRLNGLPSGLEALSVRGGESRESISAQEAPWERVVRWLEEVKQSPFCHVETQFEVSTRNPEEAKVSFSLNGERFNWREAEVRRIHATGSYRNRLLSLDVFELEMDRGGIMISAKVDGGKREFYAALSSNMDFSTLGSSIRGRWGESVRRLKFNELPVVNARIFGSWANEKLQYNIQTDIDWRDFQYNEVQCRRLFLPLGFDGSRWLVPEAFIETERGILRVDFFSSREPSLVRGRAHSTVDPRILIGFGGRALDLFLQSLRFMSEGPEIQARLDGEKLADGAYKIEGKASSVDLSYKGVNLKQISGDYVYQAGVLRVDRLIVERPEGRITGALVYDFKRRKVSLENMHSNVIIPEVAPAIGEKFVSYVVPYRFDSPPALKIDGVVDLDDRKKKLETDLTIEVSADGNMEYDLLKKTFRFEKPQGQIKIKDRTLTVDLRKSGMYGGKLVGVFSSELVSEAHPPFNLSLTLNEADVKSAFVHLFDYKESTGKLEVKLEMRGGIGNLRSFLGQGKVNIREGYILSIPFLGGLSSILGTFIPSFGFARADRAEADFKINDGAIRTENLTISSTLFSLIGNGQYDFIRDNLDLNMRANMKGLAGVFLFPVSKIFEYNGSGSLKNPVWKPKLTD